MIVDMKFLVDEAPAGQVPKQNIYDAVITSSVRKKINSARNKRFWRKQLGLGIDELINEFAEGKMTSLTGMKRTSLSKSLQTVSHMIMVVGLAGLFVCELIL
ncbi:hypothetical protein L1887_39114 [Cichorium endivia]|nr:hypothetical protein L1887_39114 [Cichorium endivia]